MIHYCLLLDLFTSLCAPSNTPSALSNQENVLTQDRLVGRDAVVQSCGVRPQQVASGLGQQGWRFIRGYAGRLHSRLPTSCCILHIP